MSLPEISSASPIVYFDRRTGRTETEDVYGERAVRLIYETRPGKTLTECLLSRAFFSKLYGAFQNTAASARKVPEFVRKFHIPMEEFEQKEFRSFNEFFVRRFRSGARPFTQVPGELPAFAEARYYAFAETGPKQRFPVKGLTLSAETMLGSAARAKPFVGGPVLLARLCPVDYHRFHYPDDGTTLEHVRLPGRLHSVNPIALRYKGDILVTNERQVSILDTQHLGKLAYVEIGALCVGRIIQTHPPEEPFGRGDEKGYFLFGGSSVALFGEPGAWTPDADLLEQTAIGRETLVRLGERIGVKA